MLFNYTHYSVQMGLSKPEELAKKAKEKGLAACGICDHNTLAGTVNFYQACIKEGIKPLIGCSISDDNLTYKVFARNLDGWYDLIWLVNEGDQSVLTKGNLVVIQRTQDLKIKEVPSECWFSVPSFNESFYIMPEDADIHRVLLCSGHKTTLAKVNTNPESIGDDHKFFQGDDYYFLKEEDQLNITDLCQEFSILKGPQLPSFPLNGYESQEEYVKAICREGWKELLTLDTEEDKAKYLERFKEEFAVLKEADLFGYFLIVWEIIDFCHKNDWIVGPGRGCFLPDTRVQLSTGAFKPIATITKNDQIIDAYGDSQQVVDTMQYDIDEEIIELEMENGKIIRCTPEHKFLTNNRGWVTAESLTTSDEIVEIG